MQTALRFIKAPSGLTYRPTSMQSIAAASAVPRSVAPFMKVTSLKWGPGASSRHEATMPEVTCSAQHKKKPRNTRDSNSRRSGNSSVAPVRPSPRGTTAQCFCSNPRTAVVQALDAGKRNDLLEDLDFEEMDSMWGPDIDADPFSSGTEITPEALAFERIMNPVVKVYCRHTEPNFSLPWQRQRQYSTSSSGFAVAWGDSGERWLLTNAHSVEYHSQVRVKRRGDERKFLAKVLAIGTECDIALLTVDDEDFWAGVKPIRLGPMPSLQESVAVVGYPVGGDTTSVTAGVVSRIEVTSYVHGTSQLLGVQIDAAINSGNSGGPVFNADGQLVGIAFQSYAGSEVENVGWVIPTAVVHHFLEDYQRNARFTGFPAMGILWQKVESVALRKHLKMKEEHRGVLVTSVVSTSGSHGVLRKGDVLLKFDGEQIASDGTVAFRTGERIVFSYLVSKKFVGDTVSVTLLRNGEVHELSLTLAPPQFLVPPHLCAGDPSYFVLSGLVFTVLSEPYLSSEFTSEYVAIAPVSLLNVTFNTLKKTADEQVVVLSQVLACEATVGYDDLSNVRVLKCNGEAVQNLVQLARLIHTSKEEFFVFELDRNEILVLNAAEARASTAEILRMHNIPAAMSRDLQAALDASDDASAAAAAAAAAAGSDAASAAASDAADAADGAAAADESDSADKPGKSAAA